MTASRDFSVDDLSARLELAGQIGQHRVSIGVKGYRFFYGERWMRINPSAAAPYAIDLFNPVYGSTAAPLRPFTNNDESRWAGTFYVQDMWDVTDRLTLVGGARIDPYRQKIVNNNTGSTGRNINEPVNFRLIAAPSDPLRAYQAESGVSALWEPLRLANERGRGQQMHIPFDPHWNELGHRLVGEALAEALIAEGLVPPVQTAPQPE